MSRNTTAPLVLVDMDGVVAHLEQAFYDAFTSQHPDAPKVELHERNVFYIAEQMPEQWRSRVMDVMHEPGFYSRMPVIAGAATALQEMLDEGLDVMLCTSPLLGNPTCTSDKLAWAEAHLGKGWAARTIIAKDKTVVRGDVLVDDKPTVKGRFTPTWTHVLFDAPYNSTAAAAHRLNDWTNWRSAILPLVTASRT